MLLDQEVYNYVLNEDLVNLKVVLDSKVPQVILDNLLSWGIRKNKLKSIQLLLQYCANPFASLQMNQFYLKNFGDFFTKQYLNNYISSEGNPKSANE